MGLIYPTHDVNTQLRLHMECHDVGDMPVDLRWKDIDDAVRLLVDGELDRLCVGGAWEHDHKCAALVDLADRLGVPVCLPSTTEAEYKIRDQDDVSQHPAKPAFQIRNDEQNEILGAFLSLLEGPTGDGGNKRAAGTKTFWKDDEHERAMWRHLATWQDGGYIDPDSGCHPLAHVAWRALAIAYQETREWNDG